MTYFGFLLRFLVIPILVFLAITWWDNRKGKPTRGFANGRAVWTAILIHVIIAVTYTTPWDNYLVATGVWYYNPELVTGIVLGYVPIEEYTFFVLETILAGLWWWFLARRIPEPTEYVQAIRQRPSDRIRDSRRRVAGLHLPALLRRARVDVSCHYLLLGAPTPSSRKCSTAQTSSGITAGWCWRASSCPAHSSR
jgi:lycopene cyclase domain-containing protein